MKYSNYPFLLPLVSIASALGGVWLNNWLNWLREKKILGVADASFLCERIEEIRHMAVLYWSNPTQGNDHEIEASITGLLFGCDRLLSSIGFKDQKYKRQLIDDLATLRQLCTSTPFGEPRKSADLTRVANIERHARVLVADVLACRRR